MGATPQYRMNRKKVPIRLLSLNRLTAGHTETQVVEAGRRNVTESERRAASTRVAPPAAAAKHAVRAVVGANWICATGQRIVIPIRAPLEHVAVHVVQAHRIRLLHANLVCVLLAGSVTGASFIFTSINRF